jgi:hypothetical protein
VLKLKINGLIDEPRWYSIPCKCNHNSVETEYPIAECLHCKFQECEDSLPLDDFTIKENDVDENGNILETKHDKTINEITIVRGKKYEDIIGWSF